MTPEDVAKKILTDRGGYEDRHRRATKTIRAAINAAREEDRERIAELQAMLVSAWWGSEER